MPRKRWTTENEPKCILEGSYFIMACQGSPLLFISILILFFLFVLTSFCTYILTPIYCFCGISECKNDWVSASCTSSCALLCLFWIFVCFLSTSYVSVFLFLLYFIYYYSYRSLLSNERQKGVHPEWVAGKKDPAGVEL